MRLGFSTIELLIALALMASTATAMTLLVFGAPVLLSNAHLERQAYGRADALLASARVESGFDFNQIEPVASTTFGSYEGTLEVKPIAEGLAAHLTSRVSWIDARNALAALTLRGVVTNPEAAINNACSPFLIGRWSMLQSFASRTLIPGDLLPVSIADGTYPIADIALLGNTLAIAVGVTAVAENPTLFFFTLPNEGVSSIFAGAFDNASLSRVGVPALTAGDGHVYAGNGFGSGGGQTACSDGVSCAQLQIFDVRTPEIPRLAATLELATSTRPHAVTVDGSRAAATSLGYRNGLIYLGLEKTDGGEEFNIIDVRDPEHPLWLGGIAIGRSIRDVALAGSYAYLATSDSARELIVVDISNPADLRIIGSWDAPGASNFGLGSSLAIRDKLLYFGRSYVGNASEFHILDVTDPAHVVPISDIDTGTFLRPESVTGILLRDFLAFVLSGKRLLVLNIHDPYTPVVHTPDQEFVGTGRALACRGNRLFLGMVDENGDGVLEIITSL